jgi:hypothetical protein
MNYNRFLLKLTLSIISNQFLLKPALMKFFELELEFNKIGSKIFYRNDF